MSEEKDVILVFNGRGQSMPLYEYISGTDTEVHDDTITVLTQINESVVHSEKPIIDPVLTFVVYALDSSHLGYVTNTVLFSLGVNTCKGHIMGYSKS